MNKTVGQLLKEIRIANNLTQKKFADKFYLTEKAVSNYETGKRKPDIDFIRTVCKEFNASLDYFAMENRESDSRDLIAVSRNNKQALFDKKQGTYLTPFNYDTIIISEFGPHIAVKLDKEGYDFFENHPFEMYIKNVVKNRIARNLIIKDIDSFRESLFNENLR